MMTHEDVLVYRVQEIERLAKELKADKADAKDVSELTAEVRGVRKLLIRLMVTICGSSIMFAFTILQLQAHH